MNRLSTFLEKVKPLILFFLCCIIAGVLIGLLLRAIFKPSGSNEFSKINYICFDNHVYYEQDTGKKMIYLPLLKNNENGNAALIPCKIFKGIKVEGNN